MILLESMDYFSYDWGLSVNKVKEESDISEQIAVESIPLRYRKQLIKLKDRLQEIPLNIDAHYRAGVLLFRAGLYEHALEFLEKVAEIKPGYKNVYFNIGLCEQHSGRLETALKAYYQHIRYNGKQADVLMNIGTVYYEMCQFPLAIFYYKLSLKLDSQNSDIWYNLGEAYEQTMAYREALSCYKKYLELNPDDDEIYFLLGRCLVHLYRNDEAEEYYRLLKDKKSDYAGDLRKYIDKDEIVQTVEEEI